MKLVGSRSTGTADAFSDWDYQVESTADFDELSARLAIARTWRYTRRGTTHIVSTIRPDFQLEDFHETGPETHEEAWTRLTATPPPADVADYWILAFKHLKAAHRAADLLLDVGLDLSVGLLRDRYVESIAGTRVYKDFFAFRRLGLDAATVERLFAVTGLPNRSREERLDKLAAMNALFTELTPELSTELAAGWRQRRAELASPS